jgi:putative redox protein
MSDEGKPPIEVQLTWHGGLQFLARTGGLQLVTDGNSGAGPSPMQLVATGLAACMAIDVVHILTRGRHEVGSLEAHLSAARARGTPAFFTGVRLHLVVAGDVAGEAVERALQLSREKYCSVWHSLRQDIQLATSFEVLAQQ